MKTNLPLFFAKYTRFEFFPAWLVYFPLLPYLIWLFIRAKSFTFFTAANPGIEMGGFFGESKIDILNRIPPDYLPVTLFFNKGSLFESVLKSVGEHNLDFPLIAKPNIGERGYMVAKVENEEELREYTDTVNADFIVQEYIDFPIEMGILFHRLPNQSVGKISSVVVKDFMAITGDGKNNIEYLLQQDIRYQFQLSRFQMEFPDLLPIVLAEGEKKILEPIGNHCRGTKFLNGNHLINPELEKVFSKIALSIEGFYYGRFDLRVKSLEDLYEGKNIKMMELNGVSSDPGHVYDPSLPMIQAYRDIANISI